MALPAPPPVRLAPLTLADVLDGAVAILKARPRTVLGIAAAFVVPAQLVAAWAARDALGGATLGEALTDPSLAGVGGDGGTGATWVALGLSWLVLPFVAAALTALVSAWFEGRELGAAAAVAAALRRAWPLLASWVLVKLVQGVAGVVTLGVGVLAVTALSLPLGPLLLAERLGPLAGLRRCWALAGRRFLPLLGLATAAAVVTSALDLVVATVPTVAGAALGLDGWGWLLVAAGEVAAAMLSVPLLCATSVLAYLDLRVRTEGLDLQLQVAALGATRR